MPYSAMMVWELPGSVAGDPMSDLPPHGWPGWPLAPLPRTHFNYASLTDPEGPDFH